MASHARKKHKSIAYEREVKAEDLLVDILNDDDDDESDEEEEEDQALETLYDDEDPESEAQLTEPEEEEHDEFLQFMVIRHGSNSVTNSEDGVYYFKAGDIGASRILQYRLRPPLQDAPRDNRHEFVFQMRCIDYQRGWRTQIRMYGVTLTHYSVVVNVYQFEPYFFVRWPWNESSEAQTQLIANFLEVLEKELETRFQESRCIKRYSLESGIDTCGFVDKTSLYLRMYLRCPSLVSKARRVIESPDWEFAEYMSGTYESDIDYVLRYMADEDFSGECTLCIRAGKYTVRSLSQMVVTTDLELDVSDYRHIKLAKEQLTIPYEVTTSCDAEMRSMSGGFPIPSRDPVISLANYSILNDDETKSNTVCFSLGESYNIRKRHPTADVLSYETEVDMMLGWMLYIRVVDPDFLTGYNIINFDLSYFLERVETLKHVDKRASQIAYLSRLAKCKCKVREDRKEDRAHGTRQNKKIYLPGRIQMDMLPIMQEFKLRSHTLNNVSKIFLGSEKEDMSYELIPEKHSTKEGRTELNSYCTKDAILPYRLMCKLRSKLKFFRKARVTGVTIEALLTRGLGFQGKSVVYRKFQRQHPRVMVYVRTEEQRQQDMLNASYGGAHVEKPIKGYYTMPIVTLDFGSLYPSIIIAQNMCVTTIITVAEAKRRGWKRASLHGDGSDGDYFQIPNFSTPGMVQRLGELFHSGQSLDGLYSDSDTCFVTPKHKVGIVPMILKGYLAERKSVKRQMAEHGETKERLREYAEDIVKTKEELLLLLTSYQDHADQIRHLLEKEDRPDKLKLQKDLTRLLWKVQELSLHVHDSVEARQDAAKECLNKAETEAFLEILADLFQLEIKLCGNSMYGLFGAKTSFLYRRELAAAVTSMGQFMILVSKLEVERKFCKANGYPIDAKVVYGDTDSIMVKMEGIDRDQARELGMEMSAFASALWPPPHKLEAEKIFQPSLFCKKKKYAAYVYLMDPETGGLQKPKVKSSGLDTVRRDNCKFTTEVMDTALNLLMTDTEGKGVERSIAFIQEQVALLLQGKISFYKLIISKQLRRDNYANPTVHSTLAARLGKRAGERIAYVIKKMPGGTKLYMCGEDPDIAFRTGVPLDYDYYLKKQIMKPIIRLFAAVLAPHLDMDVKEHEKPIHRIVIRRIFTGAHMRKRLITVNQEAIQKMGIFCIVPTCTNCKRTLKSHEKEYCTACKSQKGVALVNELRQELDQLVEANMCQWRQCQKCMEVETATHIVCDQNDCENYWNRRKTTVDLQRVSTLLESLSL